MLNRHTFAKILLLFHLTSQTSDASTLALADYVDFDASDPVVISDDYFSWSGSRHAQVTPRYHVNEAIFVERKGGNSEKPCKWWDILNCDKQVVQPVEGIKILDLDRKSEVLKECEIHSCAFSLVEGSSPRLAILFSGATVEIRKYRYECETTTEQKLTLVEQAKPLKTTAFGWLKWTWQWVIVMVEVKLDIEIERCFWIPYTEVVTFEDLLYEFEVDVPFDFANYFKQLELKARVRNSKELEIEIIAPEDLPPGIISELTNGIHVEIMHHHSSKINISGQHFERGEPKAYSMAVRPEPSATHTAGSVIFKALLDNLETEESGSIFDRWLYLKLPSAPGVHRSFNLDELVHDTVLEDVLSEVATENRALSEASFSVNADINIASSSEETGFMKGCHYVVRSGEITLGIGLAYLLSEVEIGAAVAETTEWLIPRFWGSAKDAELMASKASTLGGNSAAMSIFSIKSVKDKLIQLPDMLCSYYAKPSGSVAPGAEIQNGDIVDSIFTDPNTIQKKRGRHGIYDENTLHDSEISERRQDYNYDDITHIVFPKSHRLINASGFYYLVQNKLNNDLPLVEVSDGGDFGERLRVYKDGADLKFSIAGSHGEREVYDEILEYSLADEIRQIRDLSDFFLILLNEKVPSAEALMVKYFEDFDRYLKEPKVKAYLSSFDRNEEFLSDIFKMHKAVNGKESLTCYGAAKKNEAETHFYQFFNATINNLLSLNVMPGFQEFLGLVNSSSPIKFPRLEIISGYLDGDCGFLFNKQEIQNEIENLVFKTPLEDLGIEEFRRIKEYSFSEIQSKFTNDIIEDCLGSEADESCRERYDEFTIALNKVLAAIVGEVNLLGWEIWLPKEEIIDYLTQFRYEYISHNFELRKLTDFFQLYPELEKRYEELGLSFPRSIFFHMGEHFADLPGFSEFRLGCLLFDSNCLSADSSEDFSRFFQNAGVEDFLQSNYMGVVKNILDQDRGALPVYVTDLGLGLLSELFEQFKVVMPPGILGYTDGYIVIDKEGAPYFIDKFLNDRMFEVILQYIKNPDSEAHKRNFEAIRENFAAFDLGSFKLDPFLTYENELVVGMRYIGGERWSILTIDNDETGVLGNLSNWKEVYINESILESFFIRFSVTNVAELEWMFEQALSVYLQTIIEPYLQLERQREFSASLEFLEDDFPDLLRGIHPQGIEEFLEGLTAPRLIDLHGFLHNLSLMADLYSSQAFNDALLTVMSEYGHFNTALYHSRDVECKLELEGEGSPGGSENEFIFDNRLSVDRFIEMRDSLILKNAQYESSHSDGFLQHPRKLAVTIEDGNSNSLPNLWSDSNVQIRAENVQKLDNNQDQRAKVELKVKKDAQENWQVGVEHAFRRTFKCAIVDYSWPNRKFNFDFRVILESKLSLIKEEGHSVFIKLDFEPIGRLLCQNCDFSGAIKANLGYALGLKNEWDNFKDTASLVGLQNFSVLYIDIMARMGLGLGVSNKFSVFARKPSMFAFLAVLEAGQSFDSSGKIGHFAKFYVDLGARLEKKYEVSAEEGNAGIRENQIRGQAKVNIIEMNSSDVVRSFKHLQEVDEDAWMERLKQYFHYHN